MVSRWMLLILLASPIVLQMAGVVPCVRADEDEAVDEDLDAEANDESTGDASDNVEVGRKNVSPDADTTLLFTRPASTAALMATTGSTELGAGQVVEFLVGFTNKGDKDFIVETLDASFRYPMDFNFHIQNFSAIAYQKTVRPKEEATIAYSFIPADAFAGRDIGLTVNLAYRDVEGNFFFDPVFNATVKIVEFDEGFDSEVFFMYVMIVGVAVLALFLVYTFLAGKSKPAKKSSGASSKPVETGTANDDVDYEWIPRSALKQTPASGKTSPKQRKNKAAAGSDTE